jgi:aspartyl-tRNA(Asn)/glutamyl-tRNA(Gln) amidotransferase subunit A
VSGDLTALTIAELAPRLAAREVSSAEVTRAYLDRIERLDPNIHAYVLVTADRARADAEAADAELKAGTVRGPLHGIPIALKDLYNTAGIRTTGSSRAYLDNIPTEDAPVVAKLREAGTVLLGKLMMHELATGAPDPDGPFPPARNPWDLARMTSGSSSGSGAALAAHLCAGSLGSDTGGSIRGPAAWCGIVGHKPTYGLASRRGVMPLSWSLDHVGPMARSVEDAAILLQAIVGHDPLDDGSANAPRVDYVANLKRSPGPLTIGVPWSHLEGLGSELDAETLAVFRAAVADLEALGWTVQPVEIPHVAHAADIGTAILVSEAYAFHEQGFRDHLDRYGRPFRDRVIRGAFYSAADYLTATRARGRFQRGMADLMTRVDLIALPTQASPAQRFDDPAFHYYNRPGFTRIFNLTGQPSISVPSGFTAGGLPLGLMLSGRPFEDLTVLQAAYTYEQAHDWRLRRPPV